MEVCSDPERAWFPFRRVCYASMARAGFQAAYDALHEERGYHDGTFTDWARKRSQYHPYAANEGVTIGSALENLTPHDEFNTKVDASPVPPSGHREGEGDHAEQRYAADPGSHEPEQVTGR